MQRKTKMICKSKLTKGISIFAECDEIWYDEPINKNTHEFLNIWRIPSIADSELRIKLKEFQYSLNMLKLGPTDILLQPNEFQYVCGNPSVPDSEMSITPKECTYCL